LFPSEVTDFKDELTIQEKKLLAQEDEAEHQPKHFKTKKVKQIFKVNLFKKILFFICF